MAAVVSSRLLRIELHRVALRTGIAREEIETWLAGVALVPMDQAILSAAEGRRGARPATAPVTGHRSILSHGDRVRRKEPP